MVPKLTWPLINTNKKMTRHVELVSFNWGGKLNWQISNEVVIFSNFVLLFCIRCTFFFFFFLLFRSRLLSLSLPLLSPRHPSSETDHLLTQTKKWNFKLYASKFYANLWLPWLQIVFPWLINVKNHIYLFFIYFVTFLY